MNYHFNHESLADFSSNIRKEWAVTNGIGGYAEADASKISARNSDYIKQGYIFVSPASRGKETQSEDQVW